MSQGGEASGSRDTGENIAATLETSPIDPFVSIAIHGLSALDARLRSAEEPLPAVNISTGFAHGVVRLPEAWIGFGQTIPGDGLKPIEKMEGVEHKRIAGVAIPLVEDSRGTAIFHPLPYHGEPGEEPQESWWQQWRRDAYINHRQGQESKVVHSPEGNSYDLDGDRLIATWLNATSPFNSPPVLFDSDGLPKELTTTSITASLGEERRFIAVGPHAVRTVLRGLVPKPGYAEVLQPLREMVQTVAEIVNVDL